MISQLGVTFFYNSQAHQAIQAPRQFLLQVLQQTWACWSVLVD